MKQYLFAIIALSLGTASFASDAAVPAPKKEKATFRCEFGIRSLAKTPGLLCEAVATVKFVKPAESALAARVDMDKTKLSVRCSNGYTLHDRRAGVSDQRGNISVVGEEDNVRDNIAVLNILDAAIASSQDANGRESFDASLLVSPRPAISARLDGRCRLDIDED